MIWICIMLLAVFLTLRYSQTFRNWDAALFHWLSVWVGSVLVMCALAAILLEMEVI